jgi:hypothetical protein
MSTLQQMALRYPFKATAIVTLNLKSPRHESPFVHKIVDIIGALRWPRLPLGPAVPLLTIGPGTPTGTKTIYAGAQLAMQIDRVKQILSSLYLLGDYGSPGGNPTRASEGSLGPRGRCVSPGAGPANTSAADLTRGQSMSALRSLTFTTIPGDWCEPNIKSSHEHHCAFGGAEASTEGSQLHSDRADLGKEGRSTHAGRQAAAHLALAAAERERLLRLLCSIRIETD